MYVKINRSWQLALDGVVDVDMDYTSNDTGSSPTYYLLFSSVFFLLLFNALRRYKFWVKMTIWLWGIHSSHNPSKMNGPVKWHQN